MLKHFDKQTANRLENGFVGHNRKNSKIEQKREHLAFVFSRGEIIFA